MNLVELAKNIANKNHAGQVDKAGVPYINHPAYVAEQVVTEDEKIVAWLHDILEDTTIDKKYLLNLFPQRIVDAIETLTHRDNENYFDYINRIRCNEIARKVKLADLKHNMQIQRIKNPTESDFRRIEKYKKATSMLFSKEEK
ncbi:MAG: hypothetical protein GX802_01785 [Clostridiales bacterium]|jgi:(p)ppGpp synthase/HD superfamily hydrolase|nr:hypothetical protein [Clostridiales bacterium]